jgi:hypothetical protein
MRSGLVVTEVALARGASAGAGSAAEELRHAHAEWIRDSRRIIDSPR